jgi:hypothetical protein
MKQAFVFQTRSPTAAILEAVLVRAMQMAARTNVNALVL